MKTTKSGFTLIEMMIYISILSFLMTTAFTVAYSFVDITSTVERELLIEKTGNFALQKIEYQLRSHQSIQIPVLNPRFPLSSLKISKTSTSTLVSFFILDHEFSTSYAE